MAMLRTEVFVSSFRILGWGGLLGLDWYTTAMGACSTELRIPFIALACFFGAYCLFIFFRIGRFTVEHMHCHWRICNFEKSGRTTLRVVSFGQGAVPASGGFCFYRVDCTYSCCYRLCDKLKFISHILLCSNFKSRVYQKNWLFAILKHYRTNS